MDYTVHGILQAKTLEWVAFPFSRVPSQPRDWTGVSQTRSPTLQVDSLPAEPQGKPKNTGVGSLSLLQQILPNQESNRGLLHCRQTLTNWAIGEAPNFTLRNNTTHLASTGFSVSQPEIGVGGTCRLNWRRQWQPTPVLLPGKSYGQRSLVGCSPWGRKESDTAEWLHFHFSLSCIGEGNGNPLQCSCLENPRDGGAWWAAIYGVTQSRTRLKWLSSSSSSRLKRCIFPRDQCY